MKLPNFKAFEPLNVLKDRMGIPRNVFGSLELLIAPGRLTLRELKALDTPQGIEVSLDDIVVLPDGTLGFKGQRVVLYIRDKANYGVNYNDPRYHLANCITLVTMKENNLFGKYVANNNTTGRFEMNVITDGRVKHTTRALSVCQNCLDFLHFRGFEKSQSAARREQAVASFSLVDFFAKYAKSFHFEFPKYDSNIAPVNNYTPEWMALSLKVREKSGWRCQTVSCQVNLSSTEHRRYLHVHHRNGEKNDNAEHNLIALCIYCHANTSMHHHMKYGTDYKNFLSIRAQLLKG